VKPTLSVLSWLFDQIQRTRQTMMAMIGGTIAEATTTRFTAEFPLKASGATTERS